LHRSYAHLEEEEEEEEEAESSIYLFIPSS
jgi:hypothetical protein